MHAAWCSFSLGFALELASPLTLSSLHTCEMKHTFLLEIKNACSTCIIMHNVFDY